MTYRERREAKAERLRGWADKRENKAAGEYDQARRMGQAIPFGQPIMVGHHSERADRNYRARMGRTYDRAGEHASKARDMAARANGIEAQLATSLYSDDPDVLDRLQDKLAHLVAERDRIKAYNLSCRRGVPDVSLLDDRQRASLETVKRVAPYQLGKGEAVPSYALSNLSGVIKQTRDRIEKLTPVAKGDTDG